MSSQIISCCFIVFILFINLQLISANGDNNGKAAQLGEPSATGKVKEDNGNVAKVETPAEKAKADEVDGHKPDEHATGQVCKIEKRYITLRMKDGVATCNRCDHDYPSPRECVQEGEGNTSYSCPRASKEIGVVRVKDANGEHEAVPITVSLRQLLVIEGAVPLHKTLRHVSSLKQKIEGYNPGKWTQGEFDLHASYYTATALEMEHKPGTEHNCHCC